MSRENYGTYVEKYISINRRRGLCPIKHIESILLNRSQDDVGDFFADVLLLLQKQWFVLLENKGQVGKALKDLYCTSLFNQIKNRHKGLVINYGEGGGYKMGKSRVQNFLRPPLKTG